MKEGFFSILKIAVICTASVSGLLILASLIFLLSPLLFAIFLVVYYGDKKDAKTAASVKKERGDPLIANFLAFKKQYDGLQRKKESSPGNT